MQSDAVRCLRDNFEYGSCPEGFYQPFELGIEGDSCDWFYLRHFFTKNPAFYCLQMLSNLLSHLLPSLVLSLNQSTHIPQ